MLRDSAHVGLQCTRAEELVYDSALISRYFIGIDLAVLGSMGLAAFNLIFSMQI